MNATPRFPINSVRFAVAVLGDNWILGMSGSTHPAATHFAQAEADERVMRMINRVNGHAIRAWPGEILVKGRLDDGFVADYVPLSDVSLFLERVPS